VDPLVAQGSGMEVPELESWGGKTAESWPESFQ